MATITLPAGTEVLDLDQISDLIASALCPVESDDAEGIGYELTRIGVDKEIKQDARAGLLPIRNPLTRRLHVPPMPAADIVDRVFQLPSFNVRYGVVLVADAAAYVAERGIALLVQPNDQAEAATPASDAPATDTATPAPVVAASDGPAPLTRNEIANCFAGLRGWDVDRWKSELSSPDDWLQACQQRKGTRGRGGYESTWWPVCIAAAMVERTDTTSKLVSARFKTMEPLKQWRDAWENNYPEAI